MFSQARWVSDALANSGLTVIIMGMGAYKLPEFRKFIVPIHLKRNFAFGVAAAVILPM